MVLPSDHLKKNKIQNAKILRGFTHKSANIWKENTELEILLLYQIKIQFSKQSMIKIRPVQSLKSGSYMELNEESTIPPKVKLCF